MTADYDGLDLRDVLCICPLLVAAGAEGDEWIKHACHVHASDVLRFLGRGTA